MKQCCIDKLEGEQYHSTLLSPITHSLLHVKFPKFFCNQILCITFYGIQSKIVYNITNRFRGLHHLYQVILIAPICAVLVICLCDKVMTSNQDFRRYKTCSKDCSQCLELARATNLTALGHALCKMMIFEVLQTIVLANLKIKCYLYEAKS